MLRRLIHNRRYFAHCIEALMDLLLCKLLVVFFPFKYYATRYGYFHCETLQEDMCAFKEEILAIRCALRVVPPFLPWSSKCLDQAMAAQRMLRRRGLQSTLYFGMARQENKRFMAHAWLRCGNCWIVGYQSRNVYRVVGTYAWFK